MVIINADAYNSVKYLKYSNSFKIDGTGDETDGSEAVEADDSEANDTNEISFEEFRHMPRDKQYQRLSNQFGQEFVDSMQESYNEQSKLLEHLVAHIDE